MASTNTNFDGEPEEDAQSSNDSSVETEPHVKDLEPKFEAQSTTIIVPPKARKFTCFPKLAPELRGKIWKEACKVTRNVDLWVLDSSYFSSTDRYLHGNPHSFSSSCHPPSVLAACKESRAEGLKHYTLDFGTKADINHPNAKVSFTISTLPKIYFNWECDMLCMMNLKDFEDFRYESHRQDWHNWVGDLLKRFEEKELKLLAFNVFFGRTAA